VPLFYFCARIMKPVATALQPSATLIQLASQGVPAKHPAHGPPHTKEKVRTGSKKAARKAVSGEWASARTGHHHRQ